MADLFSVGFVVVTLFNAVVAAVALMISDKFIAHQIDVKRIFIMALVALFAVPVISTFALGSLPGILTTWIIPLVVWIALGEIMLTSDRMTKLKVAAVGFFVYIVLSIAVTPYILPLIPF